MNVTAGAKTDPGQRPNNEDQYAIVDTRRRQMRADGVLIIADGMGGRSFGEQAAATAVETVEEALAELLDSRQEGEVVIADALASALRKANARVYELSHADEDRQGMGTTCVAAVVEGETLYVAHAGDSRAYLLRDGDLKQLTDDHSYVAEQVRAGAISEEGARRSRFRNIITRAVGIEPALAAEVAEFEVRPGDQILLCTDGLSNMVVEEDIARTLSQSPTPQAAADRLVQMANKSGGKDNITAVVARLQVGTRTQRFRVSDLAPSRLSKEAASEVPPDSEDSAEYPSEPERGFVPPPRVPRRSRPGLWPFLAGFVLALSVGASAWMALLLARDGYEFRPLPPFAVKQAVSRPLPLPPDPAHVAYDSPKVFYFNPVRGDLLAVNPHNGVVTVAALSGSVLGLDPDGQVKYKYGLPFIHAQAPASAGALGAGGATLHTATDPQGNIYVSDAVAKTVTKYRPNGEPLGLVAHLTLTNPQAIAAAADGTIYLIDAERLKSLAAHPSTTPLPPIPSPKPPAPAPVALTPAASPVNPPPAAAGYHRFRHYGHYGTGYRHYGPRRPVSGGQL